MSLLNYTTGIATDKTISEIQKILASHGATVILAEYDGAGQITALNFRINLEGNQIGYRLPNDWQPVLTILTKDPKVPRPKKTKEQALRVSWRIIKDWVEAQLAIVATRMVTLDQVFLPYAMAPNGKTLYEHVRS